MGTVLSIDAGTTGITVSLYDRRGRVLREESRDFPQIYPKPGWVEHDPETIWSVTASLIRRIGLKGVEAIGITNQRETTVLWSRRTARPLHNAIVWQCRRTAPMCERLKREGAERMVRRKTGLVLDPYFSATKIRWLLDHLGLRSDAAFGTIDSWILWKLTGAHATDVTNASRTLLYDIDRRRWDDGLLDVFGIPRGLLPDVLPSAGLFGRTREGIPVTGIAGDQQAALYGQGCWTDGSVKNTYGTGCFLVANTGKRRVDSKHGLLTTLACGKQGEPVYALEGSVFIAGAAVQWLRDSLGIIRRSADVESLAGSIDSNHGVYFVPAFVGLGAPHWQAEARGTIVGLTRGSGRAELARATLESIAYQTRDVVAAMEADMGRSIRTLKVDGGAVVNRFLMQFQSDVLNARIVCPRNIESTSLGAALLAGVGAGLWETPPISPPRRSFTPGMAAPTRRALLNGWKSALASTLRKI